MKDKTFIALDQRKSKSIGYNYPCIRVGIVCDTLENQDLSDLRKIIYALKSNKDIYEKIISHLLKKHFGSSSFEDYGKLRLEQYEGPAIHSPSFITSLQSNKCTYKIVLGSTIVICLSPFKSKIWTRISLTHVDNKPAVNLKIKENISFFSSFQSFIDDYSVALYDYFHSTISELFNNITCNKIHAIDIKTTSSKDNSLQKLLSEIVEEQLFSLNDAFADKDKKNAISDCLLVSFGQKISTLDKYKKFTSNYRIKWRKSMEASGNNDFPNNELPLLSNGYQWFGYLFRDCPSLFLRREDVQKNKSYYYGFALDSEEKLQELFGATDPKSISRIIGGGIVRDLTRVF